MCEANQNFIRSFNKIHQPRKKTYAKAPKMELYRMVVSDDVCSIHYHLLPGNWIQKKTRWNIMEVHGHGRPKNCSFHTWWVSELGNRMNLKDQLFKGLCIFLLAQHLVWVSLVWSYSNASHSICKLCQWDIGMTSLRWQSSKCAWHHPLDEAIFT